MKLWRNNRGEELTLILCLLFTRDYDSLTDLLYVIFPCKGTVGFETTFLQMRQPRSREPEYFCQGAQ